MATAIKTEIKASAIYKVTVKETGRECFAVPSDSHPGQFYMTCWDDEASSWTCSCKHGEIMAQYGKGATCKHTRAAQTSVLANKANRRRAIEDERSMAELKVEMVREKFCDRCHRPATECRVQSGECLCERCIAELERNAGATRTREVLTLNGNRPLVRERGIPMR